MQVMSERCAGIDVHQRFLVVCLSRVEAGQRQKEIRSFCALPTSKDLAHFW